MSAYSDKVIADGAIAYWRLDELSGNVVSKVGNYSGTVSGGVLYNQQGALSDGNTAMAFDGSSGKIVTIQSIPFLTPFTVEGWIKVLGTNQGIIIATREAYPSLDCFYMFVQSTNSQPTLVLDYANSTSPEQIIGGGLGISDGLWHHLVGVITSLRCDLYVDGVIRDSKTLPAAFTGATYPITLSHDKFANYGSGTLDEVAIYHTALTPAQIKAHYEARLVPPYIDLILQSTVTQLIQNKVYALPAKACIVESDGTLEYSDSLDGPWISDAT